MTTLAELSASDLRRAAAIKDQIEDLQRRFNACLGGGYTGNGFRPAPSAAPGRTRRKTAKGGKTVSACILAALGNGTVPVKKILIRASQIRGKAISPGLLSYTLVQMKKSGQIKNPERGEYRRE